MTSVSDASRDVLAEHGDRRASRPPAAARARQRERVRRPSRRRCSGARPGRRAHAARTAACVAISRSSSRQPLRTGSAECANMPCSSTSPPSSVRQSPVMYELRGESRKRAAQTTSSSVPSRPAGISRGHRRADLLGREEVRRRGLGVDRAGRHRVDADAERRPLHREGPRQVQDAGLRGRRVRGSRVARPGVGRDDVQDRAAAARVAQRAGRRRASV